MGVERCRVPREMWISSPRLQGMQIPSVYLRMGFIS